MAIQVFENQYIIQQKLMRLLEARFGKDTHYTVKYMYGRWVLDVPEPLTEEEVDSCSFYTEVEEESRDLAYLILAPKNSTEASSTESTLAVSESLRDDSEPSRLSSISQLRKSDGGHFVVTPEDAQNYARLASQNTLEWQLQGYDSNGSSETGYIYNALVSQGQTCKVFQVDATMVWRANGHKIPGTDVMTKLAIKRLDAQTKPKQFFHEYDNLRHITQVSHPNIIQILGAFRHETDSLQSFNFLFPLAIGNFKQLMRGSIDSRVLPKDISSLWAQFEGLASAVTYLHNTCRIAHRDIKPSNILIYKHEITSGQSKLIAKIADFGLAAHLEDAVMWQLGTVESKSAWRYDAPEVRKLSHDTNSPPAPTPQQLRSNDIWKLGAVFTELLTYLLYGSKGIIDFRSAITTTYQHLTSDEIEDTRFDNGEVVKTEVLDWLQRLSQTCIRASEIATITMNMLDAASKRPSAPEVHEYLLNSSTAVFFDGGRLVHFSDSETRLKPSFLDIWRHLIEMHLAIPISWWPLPPVLYQCPIGSMRLHWQWCGHWLFIDLPTPIIEAYRATSCTPLSSLSSDHVLPRFNSQAHGPHAGSSSQGNQQAHTRRTAGHIPIQTSPTNNSPQTQAVALNAGAATKATGQIYWCVDKAWCEPSETWLCIEESQNLEDDSRLCARLNELYREVRGLRGRLLSWKTCLEVRFTSFNRLYDNVDQVICMKPGLPKPPQYEFTLISPEEVHMRIASKQLTAGMHDLSKVNGMKTMAMIPKKVDALLGTKQGVEGWGIYAVQGWSLWKIMVWITVISTIGLVFVVLWLVLVDSKDLQNAFAPVMYLSTVLCLAVAIPQYLDAA